MQFTLHNKSDVKIVQSGSLVEVYEYTNSLGFDHFADLFKWPEIRAMMDDNRSQEQKAKSSVSRARRQVYRLIEANVGQHGQFNPMFATFTFAENQQDLRVANKVWSDYTMRLNRFLKKQGYPRAKYLAVPEFQQRGAVHYHAIYFNIPFIVGFHFMLGDLWGQGRTEIKKVSHIRNIGAYVSKYLSKHALDTRLFRKKLYTASRGLKKPIISVDVHNLFDIEKVVDSIAVVVRRSYQAGVYGNVRYTRYRLSGLKSV
jgi:hypothetical protein